MENKKYIVAARVETENKDCIVAPADAMIIATHTKGFRTGHERKLRKLET